MVIGGGGLGGGRSMANEGVRLEKESYHFGVYCKLPHLLTVHWGGANYGIYQVPAVAVSVYYPEGGGKRQQRGIIEGGRMTQKHLVT